MVFWKNYDWVPQALNLKLKQNALKEFASFNTKGKITAYLLNKK